MIYEVTKQEKIYKVDDNVFFDRQPKAFRMAYDEVRVGDTAIFDNATVLVLPNNRVIITEIESEVGDE